MPPIRTLVAVTFLVAGVVSISAQEQNWKKELQTQLVALYPLTKMDNSLFSGRTSLRDTGIVLVVQQAGIPAFDGTGLFARFAIVRNGKVSNPQGRTGPRAHICRVGEQVYVREIEVDDNRVDVKFLTVDPIESTSNGTTRAQRYYGMVRFEFARNTLRTLATSNVVRAVRQVLATADQAQSSGTIELGQTFEQVEAILGQPTTVAKLGSKTIYTYSNMKVIFTDGRVTDVQ